MTFAEAEAALLALPRFSDRGAAAYQPGIERMEALMQAMNRPYETFPSAHIAGTNGKGSTASMLAAIATASGRRVGLHTSPHLRYLGERFRLDGQPAPKAWIADAVARYRDVFEAHRASFFEATTALAFRYFAEQGVDLAVVEVGLGGRLDATNVLHPRLAVLTTVGFDHTDILGDTLAAIAREKAGIIKPGVPVLAGPMPPEALAVVREVADAARVPLHLLSEEITIDNVRPALEGSEVDLRTPRRAYEGVRLGLAGAHQQANAALAVRAAEILFADLAPEAVFEGLQHVRRLAGLRGRLEVLRRAPLVVADVAHNPDGMAAALAFVQRHREPAGRLCVLLGLLRDKDADGIAPLLAQAQALVFPIDLESARAWPPGELAAFLRERGVRADPGGTPAAGWAWFAHHADADDALLIAGSHFAVSGMLPIVSSEIER